MSEVQQVTIKLDARVLARAEALVDGLSETTGRPCTRVDVLREALVRGLRSLERETR